MTAGALLATAIIWRKVAGHVHPKAKSLDSTIPTTTSATSGSGTEEPVGRTGDVAPVSAQLAMGVSTEVQ